MAANEPGQPPDPPVTRRRRRLGRPADAAVALAIGAHPDDVEFGCGGTLAKWAAAGMRRPPPRLHRRLEGHVGRRSRHRGARGQRRQHEQRAAARRARRRPARSSFLGWPDGELEQRRCASAGEVAYWIRAPPARRGARPRPVEALPPAPRPPPRRPARLRRHRRGPRPALLPRAAAAAPPPVRPAAVGGRRARPRRGRDGCRSTQARRARSPREPVRVDDEGASTSQLDAFRQGSGSGWPTTASRAGRRGRAVQAHHDL